MRSDTAKKYGLYAIGEILLVVLGILIALQINTWNNQRIDKKTEKEVLGRVVEDLKKDREDIETSTASNEMRMLRGVWVLQQLGQGVTEFEDSRIYAAASGNETNISELLGPSFGRTLQMLRFYYLFEESAVTFDEILSTGKLDIIRDEGVRKSIQVHYTELNRQKRLQYLLEKERDILVDYLRSKGISMATSMNREEVLERIRPLEEFVAIVENFLLSTVVVYNEISSDENSVKNLTEELIEKIENYLE